MPPQAAAGEKTLTQPHECSLRAAPTYARQISAGRRYFS